MTKADLSRYILYRWRYYIGYSLIGIALLGLLAVSIFFVPGALTSAEEQTIIRSAEISPAKLLTDAPVNAPFYLLSYASLSLLGVGLLGIKLPALLLALATAVSMFVLLRRWFSPGIAVLASLIAITTGQFLFLAQLGATSVLYIFWPTVLLLLGTIIAKRPRFGIFWKVLFFVAAALSLYTPLSIYVLIAIASTALLHPHLRFIVKRLSRPRVLLGIVAAAIILTPLFISLFATPSMLFTLLGLPAEWPPIVDNLSTLSAQYFGFMTLGTGPVMLPVFGLASMMIIIYGLYRIIRTRATVQSHLILIWLVCLLPVLVINPLFVSIMFVPLLLLLATGLESILRRWYRLFPVNPYARVAGLLPLVVLVGAMVLFGLERFGYGYRYAPATVHNFSRAVLDRPRDTTTLLVHSDEASLYAAIARFDTHLTIITTVPEDGKFATTAKARQPNLLPVGLVTNGRTSDAVEFYLYER